MKVEGKNDEVRTFMRKKFTGARFTRRRCLRKSYEIRRHRETKFHRSDYRNKKIRRGTCKKGRDRKLYLRI
jgi:hypothetical protein